MIIHNWKHFFVSFLFCIPFLCAHTQKKINPIYFIPYNDHGKWGWCDTLGNVVIQPEYKFCSFFKQYDNIWSSTVVLKNKSYPYVYQKGVLKMADIQMCYQNSELLKRDYWLVESKSRKQGIYDWKKQKLVLDTIINYLVEDKNNTNFLLYNKTNEGNYYIFNIKTKKSTETDIVDFYWSSETDKTYYRKSKLSSEWYLLSEDGHFSKTDDTFSLEYYGFAYGMEPETQSLIAKDNRGILSSIKLEEGKIAKRFIELNNQGYLIYEEVGKYGLMIYNYRKNILKPMYDSIDFDFKQNYFVLFNEGKQGVKLLGTIYPTIEPKYDKITLNKSIKVNWRWSFMVFEVELNGNKGYVGENGIEYFSR